MTINLNATSILVVFYFQFSCVFYCTDCGVWYLKLLSAFYSLLCGFYVRPQIYMDRDKCDITSIYGTYTTWLMSGTSNQISRKEVYLPEGYMIGWSLVWVSGLIVPIRKPASKPKLQKKNHKKCWIKMRQQNGDGLPGTDCWLVHGLISEEYQLEW